MIISYGVEFMDDVILKIAICDDEDNSISILSDYINKIKNYNVNITEFKSGEDLLQEYEKSNEKYDIIFLDMEMEQMNGIETANKIREQDRNTIIIFVTSHKKYMEHSFECRPFRFLVKPVDFMKFRDAFIKACETIELEHPYLIFQDGRNIIRLLYEDILYFENRSHWVYIYTFDSEYKTYMTFAKLLKQIDMRQFVITHKSYIINLNYFKELCRNDIKLRNGFVIPLSRNYKNEVKLKILYFKQRKYLV